MAIGALADELELVVCAQLAIPRPSGVLRRMKVSQLSNNVFKGGEVCLFRNHHSCSVRRLARNRTLSMINPLMSLRSSTARHALSSRRTLGTLLYMQPRWGGCKQRGEAGCLMHAWLHHDSHLSGSEVVHIVP